MRIKVKTLKTLVFAGILAIGGIFAGGMISKKVAHNAAYGETAKVGDYTCSDCVFGDLHDSNHYVSTDDISLDGFKLTSFSTAKHCGPTSKNKQWTYKDSLFMVGSNGNAGSFKIITDYDCDKVMIYAKSWPKGSSTLSANGTTIATQDDFTCMVYTFEKTKTITVSSSNRMLIQKIVVRLYDEN